jgi:hypothetical protein
MAEEYSMPFNILIFNNDCIWQISGKIAENLMISSGVSFRTSSYKILENL